MELADKVVIVTGSSTGIGQAVAEAFARQGGSVIINSRSSEVAGEQVASAIRQSGGQAVYVRADVSEEDGVHHLIARTLEKFGTIDVLINNAGGSVAMPFLESSMDHWLQLIKLNLISTVLCSREAAKVMKASGGGVIINSSSIRGHNANGRAGIMAYSAAKAAVNNFTRTLAKELAPCIRVNAVAPGFVETSNMDRVESSLKTKWLQNIPIQRLIKAEEIAEAYIFLAKSDIITGSILFADGGFTLHPM